MNIQDHIQRFTMIKNKNEPIVEEVIDESKPSIHENGSDTAIALLSSFLACSVQNSKTK